MGKISRFSIVLVSIALALWGLYPSIWWYFVATDEEQSYANMTRTTLAEELRQATETDVLEFQKLSYEDKNALAKDVLGKDQAYILDVAKRYRENYRDVEKPDSWTLEAIGRMFGGDEAGRELMRESLEDYKLEQILVYRSRKNSALRLGLDLNGGQSVMVRPNPDEFAAEVDELLAESNQGRQEIEGYLQNRIVASLQSRIDQFGLTEPEIYSYQDGRIEIVMPSQNKVAGQTDTGVVETLLQVKGSLEFHLVNEQETEKLSSYLNVNPLKSRELSETGELKDYKLPAGQVIRGYYEKDKYAMDRLRGYLVLESETLLDGENVTNARMDKDNVGQWEIGYNLNQDGAAKQQKIFTNNPGRLMAIVLDKRVLSYPRISDNAGSGGSYSGGRIKGRFSDREATNLVNVLNSGNLPVAMDIDSQRVVGATLGEESIRSGLIGIAIGLLAVVLFMVFYYRSAGFIADVALVLNLFFLIAILATMNSTLTLTGIAGIILTIGMSVDANVIIYERIKEELFSGKSRKAAIEVGFSRAFWTIIDANITTGIAAICLALFGNGGIRGFAITLAWGIVCSLFTVLFVARLIFDFNTDVLKCKKLAIMWRKISSGNNSQQSLGGV
ncbi:protein translocase subunit SecD [Candidatus Haliotispira prima]|uniref:Protein translocase subunit SecD n=1 Tax=Candidatus Haliotispira prima TaxID=3034016 RepID=A0ABY8MEM9_9SPIO|nr:protein translocase subunit SecD [Candidatus Haliotispira prima]